MAFTHGDAALNGDRILIMDDSVQDCLSDSTVITFGPVTVDSIVPFVRIVLSTEDHGTFPAAYLDDFEQVIGFDSDEAMQKKWKAFIRKIDTETDDFSTVLKTIKAFLTEPFAMAAE